MACDHTEMWNLSGLVAAFLDLWIAYLLLCASAVVYLASRFMGFFGLSLPCPCDGIFSNFGSRNLCFNRLLVDLPSLKVTDVHLSVKQKFPFCDSAKQRRIGDHAFRNEILGLDYDASCSSSPDLALRDVSPRLEKCKTGDGSSRTRSRFGCLECVDSVSHSSDGTQPGCETEIDNRGDEETAMRILEQELDAERRARAALYAELEKERSAAASAAEEALAMILRLQEEKASIYMEARQSQRIVEGKYAYDAEEINILKEILVRREKEKLVLEKEVEAYRQQMAFTDLKEDPISVLLHLAASHISESSTKFNEINASGEIGEKIIETCSGSSCSYPDLKQASSSATIEAASESEIPISNFTGVANDACRKNSETAHWLPPIGPRGLPLEQGNASLSSMDGKVLAIHCEVGLLQERLKLVQIGREKLHSLHETQARNMNPTLFDDHSMIPPLSEPQKSGRQMSLPLPPTQVHSRKRRSRSVSSGVQRLSKA